MTNKLMYFVGNWKMFGNFASIKIVKSIHNFISKSKNLHRANKIILCIPYTLIHFFNQRNRSKYVSVGGQNCHHHNHGAFTGSVSAFMLKQVGAKFVILGHSENRINGDTNKQIKMKIEQALNNKLNIIFCIGETLKEKKNKKTFSVIKKQIKNSIDKKFNLNKIIIAYEPVWSIGTGNIPRHHDLKKIFMYIKNEFKKSFKTKNFPKVLYGGSVTDRNIRFFSSIHEIDGFLIGGASTSSKKFIDIIKNYYK